MDKSMGLFRTTQRRTETPPKRSRLSLLVFLLLVFAGVKQLEKSSPGIFHHPGAIVKSQPPIWNAAFAGDATPQPYHFNGSRVRGNGTYLDLGDRHTRLPASLLIRFFPDELIVPSCLTQPAPPMQAAEAMPVKPHPIREDWPGFYGAPWISRIDGNLIAMLHVYAPRHGTVPVSSPEFQIYPGQQTEPSVDFQAPAFFQRGSKAVLYRVFLNPPLRCLDLVVQNGENNGVAHLYYQRYHHYYEINTNFQIEP